MATTSRFLLVQFGKSITKQKEAIYTDYGKIKKHVKEYDVIKQNIDSILRYGGKQERKQETERG